MLEIIGELLVQVLGEALLQLGLHALAEPFRRPPKPWLAALAYTLFGLMFGGLSLLVFPQHFVAGAWRFLNLLITPILAGLVLARMGGWRIDRFAYGYLFALALAVVRFAFAH